MTDIHMPENPLFDNAQHALTWATEILRWKELTRGSRWQNEASLYEQYRDDDEFGQTLKVEDIRTPVTLDSAEREDIAYQVYRFLAKLPAEDRELLRWHHWGDFYSSRHLSRARQVIERGKRRGMVIRLNYQFSPVQLAFLLKRPEAAIYKQLVRSYQQLDFVLEAADYIAPIMHHVAAERRVDEEHQTVLNQLYANEAEGRYD